MKIAIIGSGISGLTCSWLLSPQHEVTLFEANDYLGGHTHTVSVDVDGQQIDVDTGFIVYNDWTYPNFIGLLNTLGVETTETSMGFSVRCDQTGLEYAGSTLASLFAQRRNLLSPKFYRLIRDILRFNKLAPQYLHGREEETVGEFLRSHNFSEIFSSKYLLPMGAAIWSCPRETFESFPIRFIIEFYINHGLLLITGRPVWRTVVGGAKNYIERMQPQLGEIRLNTSVQSVRRSERGVELTTSQGKENFDEVIFASHSDQALRMLEDASEAETEVLSQFPYGENVAVLHTDSSVLPKRSSAWASWNYHIRKGEEVRPSVTYNMNILQHLKTKGPVCVTLNEEESIDPEKILGRYIYHHPIFTVQRNKAQARHSELIRSRRTSFCGAYWGNGFHEDGVNSALAVCREFGVIPPWHQEASV